MSENFYLDMPLEEAITTQRAIRRLRPDPVDEKLVLHLIELALKAPVGSNAQRWEFVVVRDPQVKKGLAALNRAALRVYLSLGRRLGKVDSGNRRVVEAVEWQMDHFEEIPVIVVACYRGRPPAAPLVATSSWYGSIYPAVQNLLLAARAAELGAALITLPLWSPGRVRRLLGLPSNVTPCCLIPMGWPLGKYGPTRRKPVGDVVHVDRFGNQPFREQRPPGPHADGERNAQIKRSDREALRAGSDARSPLSRLGFRTTPPTETGDGDSAVLLGALGAAVGAGLLTALLLRRRR